jgi:hypothetical protein
MSSEMLSIRSAFIMPSTRTRRSSHPVHRAAIGTHAPAPLIRERFANEKAAREARVGGIASVLPSGDERASSF